MTTDDVYHFDEEVQDDILYLMQRDGSFSEAASDWVKPSYFSTVDRVTLAQTIIDFFKQYQLPPTWGQIKTEMLARFSRTEITEETLLKTAKLMDSLWAKREITREYTVNIVASFARQQTWKEAIIKAAPLVEKGQYAKVEQIMEAASQKAYNLETGGAWYFERVLERSRRAGSEHEVIDVFPTGIAELDLLCFKHNGLCRKELGMFLGPKGGGKSIALMNMAKRALWSGYNVAVYSFEMAEERIEERFDASLSGVDTWSLADEKEAFEKAMKPLIERFPKSLYIKEYPTKGATVNDIRRNLELLEKKERWRPDMIIFDYATIIKPSKPRNERYIEIQEVVEELRGLCVEKNVAGWTAAQLNRGASKKHVAEGDDASGSWDQLSTLDYVFTINQDNEERARRQLRLFVDKSRTGQSKFVVGPFETAWEKMIFVKPSNKKTSDILKEYAKIESSEGRGEESKTTPEHASKEASKEAQTALFMRTVKESTTEHKSGTLGGKR